MKVNIILVEETGEEVIAQEINSTQVAALGDCLDGYIELRMAQIEEQYPECRGVYRETIKSYGEQVADKWEEIYNEELAWALEHEDEIDTDPEEYAHDMADSYFQNRDYFTGDYF